MRPSLPFAPGDSPLRVKGSICRGCVDHVGERVKGGMPTVLAALPSNALRSCFEHPFLPSGLYDAFVLDAVLRAAAQVVGQELRSVLARGPRVAHHGRA